LLTTASVGHDQPSDHRQPTAESVPTSARPADSLLQKYIHVNSPDILRLFYGVDDANVEPKAVIVWYYLAFDGQVHGPFPTRTIRVWFGKAQLPEQLPVCRAFEGSGKPSDPCLFRPMSELMEDAAARNTTKPLLLT
jgi:GYF domain